MKLQLLLIAALSISGQEGRAVAQAVSPPYKDVTLKNGLRVLLLEDHSAPVYAIAVVYNVGSRVEKPGDTGFAHLFEHMMFQGSANVAKSEHMQLIQENGGGMNGTTNADRTSYYESLPSNQLPLGLYLEADRMRSLTISQANLDNQRNAVEEERRLRMDNQPYGKSSEVLSNLVFDNFAYKHTTMGSMEDIENATVDEVHRFFKTYYAPNNAVLALVGDFKTSEALKEVEQNFGAIPSQPPPPRIDVTEPTQTSERRKTISDDFAKLPMIVVAYKTVQANTPEFYALDAFFTILGRGQSSRLYQRLVKEDKSATATGAWLEESRGTCMAQIRTVAQSESDVKKVEAAIEDEVAKLASEGPQDWEMQKLHNVERALQVDQTSTDLKRAQSMAEDAIFFNEPVRMYTIAHRMDQVTRKDIQNAARKYLDATHRSVVVTLPKADTLQGGK